MHCLPEIWKVTFVVFICVKTNIIPYKYFYLEYRNRDTKPEIEKYHEKERRLGIRIMQ